MLRRAATVAGIATVMLAIPVPVLAHGIGGREDLPVPLSFFVVGAGIAVVISFVAVSVRWPEPRLQDGPEDRPIARQWPGLVYQNLWVVGIVGLSLVVAGGLIDGSASRNNIAPVLVFVAFWLVVPFASALVGDVWRWMNPFAWIARWVNTDRPERPELLEDVGYWPAALAFMAFAWLELVSPDSSFPRTLAVAAIVYTLYIVTITAWAGPRTGVEMGGAFAIYNRLFGAMAPIAAVEAGPLASVGAAAAVTTKRPVVVHRGWFRALPVIPQRPGLTVVVVAMIGTVTYDGMSSTAWWRDLFGTLTRETWFGTGALALTVLVIGGAYALASLAAVRISETDRSAAEVGMSFAHSLVPIAFAYAFAHYFTLIVFEGQQIVRMASDPFGLGWNLFGTADWAIVYASSTTWVWYIQLAAIIGGHIAGVVLAHDRALAEFGRQVAVRTQYAMLVLMVALTSLGLFILAG